MELNNIKLSKINWGDAANDLNQNFGKINNAIEQVKNVTTRNKGYFTTSEALIDAYPNGANVGDYGYVGTSYPFNIWKWDGYNWYDTGVKGGENVNLGNFYTMEESDNKLEELSETVEEKIAELGLDTIAISSELFNYENIDDISFKDEKEIITNEAKVFLEYLGKADCDITIDSDNLSSAYLKVYTTNKETGNSITLANYHDSPVIFPLTFKNPRPDLELINLSVGFYSMQPSGNISVEVKKPTVLKDALSKLNEHDVSLNRVEIEEQIDNVGYIVLSSSPVSLNAVSDGSWRYTILDVKEGEVYKITSTGGGNPRSFAVLDSNNSILTVGNANGTYTNYELTIPKNGVKLVVNASKVQPYSLVRFLSLKEYMDKEDDSLEQQIKILYDNFQSYKSNEFNKDIQDWEIDKEISIVRNQAFVVLDYLGKTNCEVTIEGDLPQAFQFVGYNKETGNPITWAYYAEPTELPITVANPRPDLELINISYLSFSKANEAGKVKVTLTKKSPFLSIKDDIKSLLSNDVLISDMPFGVYSDESKFAGDGVGFITAEETYAIYDSLMNNHPDYVTKTFLGNEATGIPMYRYDFKPKWEEGGESVPKIKMMILSGTHPEYVAIRTLAKVMTSICNNWKDNIQLEALRWNVHFIIIPVASPWAVNTGSRVNSNGVDMARNFPANWTQGNYVTPPSYNSTYGGSEPLSELEAQYIYSVYQENKDIVIGIDFHNHYDNNYTFWIPCYSNARIEYKVACAFMKQVNRMTKKKFEYISESYKIGYVDTQLPGGSFGRQLSMDGIPGLTFETCDNNIKGYTNDNDIITISHDAFINYLLLNLRYLI